MKPVVSIVMATFNRAHLLPDTLKSINQQSFKNWECLIIDDGSTDGTKEVIKKFIETDHRFKYISRPDYHKKGLPGCRNAGVELARGKYVVFFDDDDIVHPENLQSCIQEFSKDSISFCRYERYVFTGDFSIPFSLGDSYGTRKLDISNLEEIVTGKIPFNSCQVMWKKECFILDPFNENLMYAEEWECYARILSRGLKGVSINKVLFFGRKHPESNTGEFWNNNPVRRNSMLMATKLVVSNLKERNLLSSGFVKYFIQLGIFLKEKSIVRFVLEQAKRNRVDRMKYSFFYDFYPIIVMGHRTKKLLKKKLS